LWQAARNQGKPTAFCGDWVGDLAAGENFSSFGPLEYVIHGRHDRRGLSAIEFGQPVINMRNRCGTSLAFGEQDTEPVADSSQMARQCPCLSARQGFLARQ